MITENQMHAHNTSARIRGGIFSAPLFRTHSHAQVMHMYTSSKRKHARTHACWQCGTIYAMLYICMRAHYIAYVYAERLRQRRRHSSMAVCGPPHMCGAPFLMNCVLNKGDFADVTKAHARRRNPQKRQRQRRRAAYDIKAACGTNAPGL